MVPHSVSIYQIVFSFFIWIIFLFRTKRCLKKGNGRNNTMEMYKQLALAIVFSSVGCAGGDFLHYWYLYDLNFISSGKVHVETFYFEIIKTLPNSYYLFRLVIWGLGLFILYKAFSKINMEWSLTGFIFCVFIMKSYPNLRQSLGFVTMYLGLIYIIGNSIKSSFLSKIIGILFIVSSRWFHVSMYMYIFIVCISLIPIFKSRKFIVVSLISFPILYGFVYNLSTMFVGLFENEEVLSKGNLYIESDMRSSLNVNGLIQFFLSRFPVLFILGFAIKRFIFDELPHSRLVSILLMNTYFLVYIAFLFYENKVSGFLSPRFFDAALFPFVLLCVLFLKDCISNKYIKYSLYLAIMSNITNWIHLIYRLDSFIEKSQ